MGGGVPRVPVLRKTLDCPFDEAVRRVEAALLAEGFSLMATKAIDEVIRTKLGLAAYPRYTVVLACHPGYAKGALDASKEMGLLFPCSFGVWEEEGRTVVGHVSIMKIGRELSLAPPAELEPVIECTSEGVGRVWARL